MARTRILRSRHSDGDDRGKDLPWGLPVLVVLSVAKLRGLVSTQDVVVGAQVVGEANLGSVLGGLGYIVLGRQLLRVRIDSRYLSGVLAISALPDRSIVVRRKLAAVCRHGSQWVSLRSASSLLFGAFMGHTRLEEADHAGHRQPRTSPNPRCS